ncbi:MAG: hypothetical protein ACHQD9_00275 [Chitinophagales bacterium]
MEKRAAQNKYHAVLAIVIGFSGSCFTYVLAQLIPSYEITLFLEKFSVGLYLFASTVQGLSLTEEKKTMPAAGFTMMAIAQGVIFTTYFEPNNLEGNTQSYELFDGGLLLFFPAMILISFYHQFPIWVKTLGIISCVPFLIDYIIFEQTKHYTPVLDTVYMVAQIMLETTAVIWSIFIWKNYKRESELPD